MKRLQKGFTAIEGLLIAIIVLMIGFIGYYVYHSQQQANKTLNTAQADNASTPSTKTSSSTSSTKTAQVSYLDVKQLGIKFQLSSKISDAYYAVDSNGYYRFSVHSFDNNSALAGCTLADLSQDDGVVALIVAKPGQPGADEAGDAWTAQSIQQAGLVQVGDTYYGFQKGNGPCFDPTNAAAEAAADGVISAFVAAQPTITKD